MRARRVDDDGVDWIYWIVLIARIVVDNGRPPANSLYFISLIILSRYDKSVIFINLFVQPRGLDRFVSTGAVSDRVTDRRTGRKVNNNSRSMSPSYKTRGVVPKSASFHWRIPLTSSTSEEYRQMMIRRPKTHPELLRNSKLSSSSSSTTASKSRLPAKVPVNVTLRSSMWAVQVMASTEWKVEDLISASLRQYIKEGRKPLLPPPSIDPSFYNLHYSQYSFQSLHPDDKLIELGSRNFFLCPKTVSEHKSYLCSPAVEPSPTMTPVARKSWIFSVNLYNPIVGSTIKGVRSQHLLT